MIRIVMDSSKTHRDPSSESRRLGLFGQLCAEARRFGALVHPEEEGIVADFPESRSPGLLAPSLFLESASAILAAPDAEPARIRLRVFPPGEIGGGPGEKRAEQEAFYPGVSAASGALAGFTRYFAAETLPGTDCRKISRFRFRKPLCPPGEMAIAACPDDIAGLRSKIREFSASAISCAAAALFPASGSSPSTVGTIPAPLCVQGPSDMAFRLLLAAFKVEFGDEAALFPIVGPGSRKRNAFSPIIDGIEAIISGLSAGEPASEEEGRIFGELAAGVDFFRHYPYRTSFCQDLVRGLSLDFRKALELYARRMAAKGLPAWIILRWPEELSEECLALLGDPELFRAGKGILVAAGSRVPTSPQNAFCRDPVRIAGLSFADTIQVARKELPAGLPGLDAVAAARASLQDPLRLALIIEAAGSAGQFSPLPGTSFEELAKQLLENLPEEHSRYLVLLSLAEGVLTGAEFVSYMASQGFPKAALDCVEEYFSFLGFISRESGLPKPVFREVPSIAKNILPDSGSELVGDFLRLLEARMKSGKVRPCLALYRSLSLPAAEDATTQTLALECIAQELALDPAHPGTWTIQDSPCAPWSDFLSAQEMGDREGSAGALIELERSAIPGTPSRALALLARACSEYAEHRIPSAASYAKSAILESGGRRPPLIEARAQRILGLCSLATGQLIQGSAYLSNSADLAGPSGDWMECARAKIAEAGSCLAMGDFGRAGLLARETSALSKLVRRHYPEEAAFFVLARIDFELGRYAGASRTFGALETIAGSCGHDAVCKRAGIWKARSDCHLGDTRLSRAILDREYADPEARWFLAECLLDLGMTSAAAEAAAEATRLAGFAPESIETRTEATKWTGADWHSWQDGFSSLEGLSVGYGASRSLASDRILAFSLYTTSLAQPATAEKNLDTLLSLARENRLATVHPYSYLYFYYAYRLSLLSECAGASPLSLLGRAFKALQLRAGKLGREADFADFFESNREHAAIMAAARASKLM